MPNALDSLRRLTALLLDPPRPDSSFAPEVDRLAACLSGSASFVLTRDSDLASGGTRTANGLAISPSMAAICVEDRLRTLVFLRAAHAAIRAARARVRGRPVRVLYVGCGPYATLAVPLMSVLSAEEAQFTMLDLHPESIASARAVVGSFGLAASVAAYETVDAGEYRVDPEAPPDVIVMEILQTALVDEPQVAVTRHLLPQAPDALVVPEEIRLDLVLSAPEARYGPADGQTPERWDRLGTAFVLSREAVASWGEGRREVLPGACVPLPAVLPSGTLPFLATEIRAFGDHVLGCRQSGLTMPLVFGFPGPFEPRARIHFEYVLGARPHLRGRATT